MTELLQRFANVKREEIPSVLAAGTFFFCVLTALQVIRPARDALGMQAGIEEVRWLFQGTLIVTLLVNPEGAETLALALHEGKVRMEELFVKEAVVGAGPTLKRWLPRAQGRATPLLKRMSHVSVTVATRESL